MNDLVVIPKVILTDSPHSRFVFPKNDYPYILLGVEDDAIEDDLVELMLKVNKEYKNHSSHTMKQKVIKENGYLVFRRGLTEFARVKIK